MSKLLVGGVRLDTLLAMEPGAVINAVPEDQRQDYWYWRGVHLGKVALNLMQRRMVINAGTNDHLIHFSGQYDDAPRIAQRIAQPTSIHSATSQWNDADAQLFAELAGVPAPDHFAGAVIAARYVGRWSTSKHDPGWGYSVERPVGFHEIDPHSLRALEKLFGVDLLTQPESLEPGSPLPPAPIRAAIVPVSPEDRPIEDYIYALGERPRNLG